MKTFLMRHGEAVALAENDAKRHLTEQGRCDIAAMVARCRDELMGVDEIWSSHYVRAQQTAQLLVELLGENKPLITHKWLTPSSNPEQLMQALKEAEDKTILIVTHQPLIGTVVDRFAGLETGRYRMGTAAIACVETDVMAWGCGELLWLHQP